MKTALQRSLAPLARLLRRALPLAAVAAIGCAPPPPSALPSYDSTRPGEFKQAVEILSKVLVSQYETHLSKNIMSRVKKARIAIEPFAVQASAGDVEEIRGVISASLFEHLSGNAYFETVAPEFAKRAEYFVKGELVLKSSPEKISIYYLLSGAVVERRTGAIVSTGTVKVQPLYPAPTPVAAYDKSNPYDFNEGMNLLSRALLYQYEVHRYQNNRLLPPHESTDERKMTAMDPFVVQDTGDVLKVNQIIENIFTQNLSKSLNVTKTNRVNSDQIEYVIIGMIALEKNPAIGNAKTYHVYATLYDKTSGTIVGNGDVWVSNIDYAPLELYKDSPVYIRSNDLENLSRSVKTKVGEVVDKSLLRAQNSKALFAEADAFYEKREYAKALPIYLEIEKRDDGKTIKVYAVLYNISFLTGDYAQAEYYFARLTETCIAEKGNIEVKLLFKVRETDYVSSIRGRDTSVEYDLWMRQIGAYLETHPRYCLMIAGHASRTGTDEYNVALSKKRAAAVQQHLRKYFPEIMSKSKTVGMGYRDNIIGTAADDDSDSIDRRVEFSLIDCKGL
jgi:hypothetical protein